MLINFAAFVAPLLSSYLIAKFSKLGKLESILAIYLSFTSQIILTGYLLSYFNVLSDIRYWSLFLSIQLFIILSLKLLNFFRSVKILPDNFNLVCIIKNWYTINLNLFEKLVLICLLITVIIITLTNFIVIIYSAPNNIDAMTYHLPRMAHYIQNNNLKYFETNFWAQVVHPKNSTVLFIYTYLVSGRNENFIQYVQYFSYLISIISIYLIALRCSKGKAESLFAALISSLLINWIMESTTSQNDMIITAFTGCAVYFLLSFKEKHKTSYIMFTLLSVSLAVGTKSTALLILPSLVLITIFPIKKLKSFLIPKVVIITVIFGFIFFWVFIFQAGYWDNLKIYDNFFGPKDVRLEHSFDGKPLNYIFKKGATNIFRYGSDFISFDGLISNPVQKVMFMDNFIPYLQLRLKTVPRILSYSFGLSLLESEGVRNSFYNSKQPSASEDVSYWGIFGFGLIWISIFVSIFYFKTPYGIRLLALSASVFFLCQAFVGPYDALRGRYFTTMAIFAVPSCGFWLRTTRIYLRLFLLLVILIGILSAFFSVYYRPSNTILKNYFAEKNYFQLNRLEQLTIQKPLYLIPFCEYERIVPNDATVAINKVYYEYPLFGEGLTRRIYHVNNESNLKGYDFYLYEKDEPLEEKDMYLGHNLYLRNLKFEIIK